MPSLHATCVCKYPDATQIALVSHEAVERAPPTPMHPSPHPTTAAAVHPCKALRSDATGGPFETPANIRVRPTQTQLLYVRESIEKPSSELYPSQLLYNETPATTDRVRTYINAQSSALRCRRGTPPRRSSRFSRCRSRFDPSNFPLERVRLALLCLVVARNDIVPHRRSTSSAGNPMSGFRHSADVSRLGIRHRSLLGAWSSARRLRRRARAFRRPVVERLGKRSLS